jgi:hypothetical protein
MIIGVAAVIVMAAIARGGAGVDRRRRSAVPGPIS